MGLSCLPECQPHFQKPRVYLVTVACLQCCQHLVLEGRIRGRSLRRQWKETSLQPWMNLVSKKYSYICGGSIQMNQTGYIGEIMERVRTKERVTVTAGEKEQLELKLLIKILECRHDFQTITRLFVWDYFHYSCWGRTDFFPPSGSQILRKLNPVEIIKVPRWLKITLATERVATV